MTRALFLVMALLWSGPAPAQPAPASPQSIRSIGVVTVVPSKIPVFRFGYFSKACDWLDITGLHVDQAAFEGAAQALSSKYRMVRTKVARDAVIRTSNTEVMGAFKSFPSIGEQVRQIARPDGSVDAYLLLWSSPNKCDLNPGAIGYGFGLSKNLQHPPNLHTFAGLSLIDARTLQIIGARNIRPAYVRLDDFEWKDSIATMTAQQRQLIQRLIPQLVKAGVATTSRELLQPTPSASR